jgi:hypothetical protein
MGELPPRQMLSRLQTPLKDQVACQEPADRSDWLLVLT